MSDSSVFTRIINGELPSHKIYEDERTIAIMDINPMQEGMVVVIPKCAVENFYELLDEDYTALMSVVKKVALKLHKRFPEKKRIAVQIEGLDVPHVHVKLFPIDTGADFRSQPDTNESDHAQLERLAKELFIES